MRKAQKQEILDFIENMHQAHGEIKNALTQKKYSIAQNMLSECQDFAINLGETIEKLEGENCITISYIEEYCEQLFHTYEGLDDSDAGRPNNANNSGMNPDGSQTLKQLNEYLVKIENSIKKDIPIKKEIVFFPYKASMWDSLESVYFAAKEDQNCDVYCVPIPYYDLNTDRSVGQMHYEGSDFPKDIEITNWRAYRFDERRPDVIYIHNPYDDWNFVTTVHPRFYSDNLKKYTDCLVYIPYYTTAGGMGKGQRVCPAYFNVDYIIIQAPCLRTYFDETLPDHKFLSFGSPKFDRIIHTCQNPPQPPSEWEEKMIRPDGSRRKVYFYNTSIAGLINDAENFLNKMKYVFDIFQKREEAGIHDSCLLWRPHPLLESTLEARRPQYKPIYENLKNYYIENDIGILDLTPDIGHAIAWSDAYIGDSGTSVISLFGIVGKPVFILNNRLHSEPEEDSWRGEIIPGTMFNYLEKDRFAITQGNKLYISQPYQYDYKYFCDLSEYTGGDYYSKVFEINGIRYVCPANAQNIIELDETGIRRKIQLEERMENPDGAFATAWKYEKYLLLIPRNYSALVRYDTESEEITYIEESMDFFACENERKEKISGGSNIYDGKLYISSPIDSKMYVLDIVSGKSEVISLQTKNQGGYCSLVEKNGHMWMLPYRGQTILRWEPKTGEIREYTGFPKEFYCEHPVYHVPTDEYPFGGLGFKGKMIYLAPNWGNVGLKLDTETGEYVKWNLPVVPDKRNEYFFTTGKYAIIWNLEDDNQFKIFTYPDRKLYYFDVDKIDMGEMACKEIKIRFDKTELEQHASGFNDHSQWLKYCCLEDSVNSLKDFLDSNIKGKQHDLTIQKHSYEEIAANNDGSCGRKVHEYMMCQLYDKENQK